jgi:hypothetical protein
MSGFPIAWDDGTSDRAIPSKTCPYTAHEIEQYLRGCHYHWVRDEAPSGFAVTGPVLSRSEAGRSYWLFSARDDREQEWFVVVGSGTSPFSPHKTTWRWMYAETNDLDQTPDAFMKDAYAQQLVHDMRDAH